MKISKALPINVAGTVRLPKIKLGGGYRLPKIKLGGGYRVAA